MKSRLSRPSRMAAGAAGCAAMLCGIADPAQASVSVESLALQASVILSPGGGGSGSWTTTSLNGAWIHTASSSGYPSLGVNWAFDSQSDPGIFVATETNGATTWNSVIGSATARFVVHADEAFTLSYGLAGFGGAVGAASLTITEGQTMVFNHSVLGGGHVDDDLTIGPGHYEFALTGNIAYSAADGWTHAFAGVQIPALVPAPGALVLGFLAAALGRRRR